MGGVYAEWQPLYAACGIATFPVRNKRPVVKGYLKAGLKASEHFASKFPSDDAFGFACKPSGITVLDVDAPDERLLCDALSEFGPTPILVRSGSGNFQAWYRHNGEGRQVRPDPSRPIDILGNGFVVAPPSIGTKGSYELIQGSLADLVALPTMRRSVAAVAPLVAPVPKNGGLISEGKRNQTLWRLCMGRARSCSKIEELMEVAVQLNRSTFYEPLPDIEVLRIVASAWSKELSGENWFGSGQRMVLDHAEVDELLYTDPDAFILLMILKRHHWGRRFVVANAMHETMPGGGWRRERFTATRKRLLQLGEIVEVTPASHHSPALYQLKGAQI